MSKIGEIRVVQLSTRARRELAFIHAADAMRVLAAAAIPLHVLPFGGVLFAILTTHFAWLGYFLVWSTAQVVLHLTLIRAAENLLEQTRRNVLVALISGTLLLALSGAGQVIVAGVMGVGLVLVIVVGCGLFDVLAVGALFYVYWATYQALFGRLEPLQERHVGFEVVLPDARMASEPSATAHAVPRDPT